MRGPIAEQVQRRIRAIDARIRLAAHICGCDERCDMHRAKVDELLDQRLREQAILDRQEEP